MTNEEKAIARAIAENVSLRMECIGTDVGTVKPFLPPQRKDGNTFAVAIVAVVYDVEVVVRRRP